MENHCIGGRPKDFFKKIKEITGKYTAKVGTEKFQELRQRKNFERISDLDVEELQNVQTKIRIFLVFRIDFRVKDNFSLEGRM